MDTHRDVFGWYASSIPLPSHRDAGFKTRWLRTGLTFHDRQCDLATRPRRSVLSSPADPITRAPYRGIVLRCPLGFGTRVSSETDSLIADYARADPRVKIAVPIIGLPFEALHKYLGARALSLSLAFQPPIYPPSLKPFLEAPPPQGCYSGKRILGIHGADDTLVPIAQGREDIDNAARDARGGGGEVAVWIQEGKGHMVSVEMVRQVTGWVWRWAIEGEGEEDKSVGRISSGRL